LENYKSLNGSPALKAKATEMYPLESHAYERFVFCDVLTYITNKSISLHGNDTSFVEFGSRLLRLRHSSRAQAVLNSLKAHNILEPYVNPKTGGEHYLTKEMVRGFNNDINSKGICKKYRLNSIYSFINYQYSIGNISSNNPITPLLSPEACQIPYLKVKKRYSAKSFTDTDRELYADFQKYTDMLDIDYEKLTRMAISKIENTKIEDFKTNNSITNEKFEVMFLSSKKKVWMTKEKAIEVSDFNHETLIEDDKEFYIGGKEQFLDYKKKNMDISYKGSIERLKTGDLYCKRNKTNNRLDHNFTNFPGFLFKEVMKDNKLGQWDIKNAQFAILAHMMEKEGYKTEDFKKFCNAAYSGNLYDEAIEILGCETRNETKTSFFEILFSKSTSKSARKDVFLNKFPTVSKYVNKIKEEGKYQDVSTGLQSMEAFMCIDNLYPRLKETLSFQITKHDAFVVKIEEKEKARKVIQNYFDEIGFKGKIAWEQCTTDKNI